MISRTRCFHFPWILANIIFLTSSILAQDNTGFVERILKDNGFNWKKQKTEGVVIYFQEGSFAERHRAMFLRSVSVAVEEVKHLLGEEGYPRPINVFYLDSRSQMREAVGQPYTGFAAWSSDAIFVVCHPEWRSFEKHELIHLFSMGLWGHPDNSSRWMVEGLAVFGDGFCGNYTVDELASLIVNADENPPLEQFFTQFRSLGEIRGGMISASFIGYLHNEYGADSIKKLWQDGMSQIGDITGKDVDRLEAEWKRYLQKKVPETPNLNISILDDLMCGE